MFTVSLSLVRPSPNPIRKTWDEDKMQELAASIKERGVIVPIKVRSDLPGYQIVYGHRRVEAARRAGLTEIPAIVEESNDTNTLIEALIENLQREDMTPYDKGAAILELQSETGWSIKEMDRRSIASEPLIARWIMFKRETDKGLAIASPLGDGVQQVEQLNRSLGDDMEAKKKVAVKVSSEELNWRETRAVADAYKAADSPELRDAVLNTSGKLGDADRILQVAQMSMGAGGLVERHENERRQSFEEYDQAAKDFFDFMKLSKQMVKAAQGAARYGKFSPEGAQFAIGRINTLIDELETLKEALSHVE